MTRDAWLRDASYSASIICSRFGDATPLPGRGDTPPGIVLSSGGEEVLLGNLNNYTCYSYTCYYYTRHSYTCTEGSSVTTTRVQRVAVLLLHVYRR